MPKNNLLELKSNLWPTFLFIAAGVTYLWFQFFSNGWLTFAPRLFWEQVQFRQQAPTISSLGELQSELWRQGEQLNLPQKNISQLAVDTSIDLRISNKVWLVDSEIETIPLSP